jgi:bifunctional DNA-binding transcriptional regulator/antitoxin component of YhaV-PrlF toxin-antitoxin module
MRFVLKIRRKEVLILPKKLREAVGLKEGDLKPKVVDVDPNLVEELLGEESRFEEHRYRKLIQNKEK